MLKNIGAILVVAIIAVVLIGTTGIASAITPSFQAKDPADTSKADFDIIAFGATPNGNKIDFWIQVRGHINTNPEEGHMNAYSIDIYSNKEDYEIAAFWINYQGNIQSIAWFGVGDNNNYLSSSDYSVSGNKLTFHIDSTLLSDLGEEYQVIVTTVNTESTAPSLGSIHTDQAEYDHGVSGNAGNEDNEGPSNNEMAGMAILSSLGLLICSVIWLIVWILVALWAYKDAKKLCMDSPIVWFLVVFFLGIIGIIIYAIIRKDKCKEMQTTYMPPPPPS